MFQVEQLRNELLQERATRQDLECDRIALERQVLSGSILVQRIKLPVRNLCNGLVLDSLTQRRPQNLQHISHWDLRRAVKRTDSQRFMGLSFSATCKNEIDSDTFLVLVRVIFVDTLLIMDGL